MTAAAGSPNPRRSSATGRCGTGGRLIRLSGLAGPDYLADFDEVSVRVTHIAPDLAAPVDGRREEVRPSCLPALICGRNVSDAYGQEARGSVRIAWRLEGDGRLVRRGASSDGDGDPPVSDGHGAGNSAIGAA